MLLGTIFELFSIADNIAFQSPERIHAFGNIPATVAAFEMDKFQSPERIHAFGNPMIAFWHDIHRTVSIPREDSCFWEHTLYTMLSAPTACFNPQRGFMLLGTWYTN